MNALTSGQPKVAATLTVLPGYMSQPRNVQAFGIAMTRLGTRQPITRYDVELTKRLHLIAVSGDFGSFVHEHAEAPGTRGLFQVAMPFPHGGPWHIYADAVPSGLGQQVMRFDLDMPWDPPVAAGPAPAPVLEAADGRYAARFDALQLRAGEDSELRLHLLRDGAPAPDAVPYLGVPAHVVLVGEADLSYTHVHASLAGDAARAGAAPHGMTRMGHGSHAGMPGMGNPAHGAVPLPPDLVMRMHAPKAGAYRMWVQFMAGGQVRTVPFSVTVG